MTRPEGCRGHPGLPGCLAPGRRILVVDDEPMVLATHVDLLVSWGLEVVAADDGPAALRARGRGMLDAVVTDFRMPHMTGIELVETLRREDPLLPGIVVSGEAAPRWTALAAAPRRTLWLTKPVAPELLMDRLAAVICRRAACRRAIRAA